MDACMHGEIGETMRNNSRGKMLNADTGFDPLEVLGQDLMMRCLEFLDANSLALSLLVSRSWFSLSSSDLLWSPVCEQLWVGKAHIPRRSKLPGLSKLACYSRAVVDSKRVRITRDDLCDHAWNFHFTEATSNVLLSVLWIMVVYLGMERVTVFKTQTRLRQLIGEPSTHIGPVRVLCYVAIFIKMGV
ncbi:uncharacterized protein LOC141619166 [Silene latifolia]|uniref:uncharacterized protein LOC141619166 n=1 Tax=Silene latifolia TaxID=37657 RepID=UPI003D789E48